MIDLQKILLIFWVVFSSWDGVAKESPYYYQPDDILDSSGLFLGSEKNSKSPITYRLEALNLGGYSSYSTVILVNHLINIFQIYGKFIYRQPIRGLDLSKVYGWSLGVYKHWSFLWGSGIFMSYGIESAFPSYQAQTLNNQSLKGVVGRGAVGLQVYLGPYVSVYGAQEFTMRQQAYPAGKKLSSVSQLYGVALQI